MAQRARAPPPPFVFPQLGSVLQRLIICAVHIPFSHKIRVFKNLVKCRHLATPINQLDGGTARLDQLSMMAAYLKLTKLTH